MKRKLFFLSFCFIVLLTIISCKNDPIYGIVIPETYVNIEINEKKEIYFEYMPNNKVASFEDVVLTSSNPEVCTVNNQGVLQGVNDGIATITVTTRDGKFSATMEVTVGNGNTVRTPYHDLSTNRSDDEPFDVILKCDTKGAVIHYTLDGSKPTKESPIYTEPIHCQGFTTLYYFAEKKGYADSSIQYDVFHVKTVKPQYEVKMSDDNITKVVTLSVVGDRNIYYKIDTSNTSYTNWDSISLVLYTGPIKVSKRSKIRAYATYSNIEYDMGGIQYLDIEVQPGVYPPYFATPNDDVIYNIGDIIKISANDRLSSENLYEYALHYSYSKDSEGNDYYWVKKNTTNREEIVLKETCEIKAYDSVRYTYEGEEFKSQIICKKYRVKSNTSINTASNTYSNDINVCIKSPENTTIYYSLDGNVFEEYNGNLKVGEDGTTVYAYSIGEKLEKSDIVSAKYSLKVADPVFSLPTDSEYFGPQTLLITTETEDAQIEWSEDGENWKQYDGSIILAKENCTIYTRAKKDGYQSSDTVNAKYTLHAKTASFYPSDSTFYSDKGFVTLSVEDAPDSIIYYTIDGSEPSESSTVYTEPIEITKNTKIKAIVKCEGLLSEVTQKQYSVFSGKVGDDGPAGGIVIYDKGEQSDGWRFIEMTKTDVRCIGTGKNAVMTIDETYPGYSSAPEKYPFGFIVNQYYNKQVVGATDKTIGGGKKNTTLLRTTKYFNDSDGLTNGSWNLMTSHRICWYLVVTADGLDFDDWYLPSVNEFKCVISIKSDDLSAQDSYATSNEKDKDLYFVIRWGANGKAYFSETTCSRRNDSQSYKSRVRAVRYF